MGRLRSIYTGASLLLAAAATLYWISLASALGTDSGTGVNQGQPESSCEPHVSKVVDPATLELGDQTRVDMQFEGRCPDQTVKVHLVGVIDRSNSMTKGALKGETPPAGLQTPTDEPRISPTPDRNATPTPPIGPGEPQQVITLPASPTREGTPGRETPTEPVGLNTPTPGLKDEEEPPSTEDKLRDAQQAFLALLDEIDWSSTRVGLVSFNDRAREEIPLTDNRGRVAGRVLNLRGGGNTDINQGVTRGIQTLLNGRERGKPRDYKEVLFVFTDGINTARSNPTSGARRARSEGMTIVAVGFGRDADQRTLRDLASEPKFYIQSGRRHQEIIDAYDELAVSTKVNVEQLTVRDELAADVLYVPGSANPPPSSIDPTGKILTWTFPPPIAGPVAINYMIEPQVAGVYPTSVEAKAIFQDSLGLMGDELFPNPLVDVVAPPPTPTYTPTFTGTPPPTPTHTPTREPDALYFPFVGNGFCIAGQEHVDVGFVVDTSTSMYPDNIVSALSAVRVFVEQLRMPEDQAAVIVFNNTATTVQALTGDRRAVLQALDVTRLPSGAGTRMDLGLHEARLQLTGPLASRGNRKVTILLSDGQMTADTSLAVAAADQAKTAGISVWTVGLGEIADQALLMRIATRPDQYFFAPTAAQLEEAYRTIVATIECPD